MSNDRPDAAFAIVAVYDGTPAARDDYEAIEELATSHDVHVHDLAIVEHRDGQVKIVRRDERSAAHGAEGGVIIGALLGILFPPALLGLLVGAAAGAGIGGVIGHLWRGFSRGDLKDLGDAVEEGHAAIIVIGTAAQLEAVEGALTRAARVVRKDLDADLDELRAAASGEEEGEQAPEQAPEATAAPE
ncbi:MAG TPA: DUF1269 domain-containing protein [Solirubrobacteraceae bacterium]|nr:DUF1269 domain-containing protein [Solirubrobacteraceae bacterium]